MRPVRRPDNLTTFMRQIEIWEPEPPRTLRDGREIALLLCQVYNKLN